MTEKKWFEAATVESLEAVRPGRGVSQSFEIFPGFGPYHYGSAVHPVIACDRPFWNAYSYRFMYAPAFDYKLCEGAKSYRFTVGSNVFEADKPWASLGPIWKDIEPGGACLKVEALKEKGGDVLFVYPLRSFFREAVFNGPYEKPAMSYEESALRQFELIMDVLEPWKDPKSIVESESREKGSVYQILIGRFPTKYISAAVSFACYYAKVISDSKRAIIKLAVKIKTLNSVRHYIPPPGLSRIPILFAAVLILQTLKKNQKLNGRVSNLRRCLTILVHL